MCLTHQQSNPASTTRKKDRMLATRTPSPTPWRMAASSQTSLTQALHNWTSGAPRYLKFIHRVRVETSLGNRKATAHPTSAATCRPAREATAALLTRRFTNSPLRATTTKTRSCKTSTNSLPTTAKRITKMLCLSPSPCSNRPTWSLTHTTSITARSAPSRIT